MEIVECQEGYTSSGRFRQVTEKQAGCVATLANGDL